MRILLLSWNFPPALGGIEYVVDHLFRGLKAAGHEVHLITTMDDKPEVDPLIHRCPKAGLKAYNLYAIREGRRLIKELKPDLIVNGSIASGPAAWWLAKLSRLPNVILMHGSDILHEGWLYQRVVRFLVRQADRLASNSLHTKELLVAAGVKPARVEVVHPGVCVEHFVEPPTTGAEAILEYAQNRRVIMTVGRLIKRKGVLEFVEQTMPLLRVRFPDVLFLIVGDDAKQSLAHKELMKDLIARKVNELGLEDHVKLLGKLPDEDLFRLYFLADIFVLPCLNIPGDVEGFGIVFSEAALAGTASVATRVGGIPEAVQDELTGLLAEPGDFIGLAERITRLLADEPERKRLADAGANRARTELAWPVITQAYIDLFAAAQNK
jgi:phosphatidyl-myo-inositol dimannoside synthase